MDARADRPSSGVFAPGLATFKPGDVYIAVMGVTGAGKSTFISKCCDEAVGGVGHGLKSMTSEMKVYTYMHNGRPVHLIDTPGFDDTYKTDTEVLKELAYYLAKSYGAGIRLTGIIYLHPITHTRLTGTAFKNLRTFRKLCGKQSMSSTVLVTTMWEDVDAHMGARREKELKKEAEFWGDMIKEGSRVMQHANTRQSALAIVSTLLMRNETTVLGLQTEMVVEGVSLEKTAAGREVDREMRAQREAFERRLKSTKKELEDALNERDEVHVNLMLEEQAKWESKLNSIQKGRDELRIGLEKLIAEKDKQHMAELAAMKDQLKGAQEETQKQVKEYEKFKAFMEARDKVNQQQLEEMQEQTSEAQAAAFLLAVAAKEKEMEDQSKQKEMEFKHKEEMLKLQLESSRSSQRTAPPPYTPYASPPQQISPQNSYHSPPVRHQRHDGGHSEIYATAAAGAGLTGAGLAGMAALGLCNVM